MLTDEQVEQLKALRSECLCDHRLKFLDNPREYEADAIAVANGLGLAESPFTEILDIGSGPGYFLRACHDLGHRGFGIDCISDVISRASKILDVLVLASHPVEAYTPIWRFTAHTPLDLVTMFGVNLHDGIEYWDADKYAFLVRDVRTLIKLTGRFVIRPNAPVGQNSPTACLMDAAWWQKVAGPDAEITTTINHSFQVTITWKP
jgi:SAM-dependent methyltransferase